MIAALLLALLPQAGAPAAPIPAPPGFYRAWEDADVSTSVAEERMCGRAGRARIIARLRDRLRRFLERATALYGEYDQIVPLLEPSRRGPACDRFRPASVHAGRRVDAAEAFLAAAEAERRR